MDSFRAAREPGELSPPRPEDMGNLSGPPLACHGSSTRKALLKRLVQFAEPRHRAN